MSPNPLKMDLLLVAFKNFEWDRPDRYGAWLAQSYYYTRYSTRMLAFAAGWAEQDAQTCYRRSLQHIREEQGHDQIALNSDRELIFANYDQTCDVYRLMLAELG